MDKKVKALIAVEETKIEKELKKKAEDYKNLDR